VAEQEPAKKWASEHGTTFEEIIETQNADYKKVIMDDIKAMAKESKFNSLEIPKDIYMSGEAFSAENDILTPTFKLKRHGGVKYF